MTAAELAEILDIPHSTIARWLEKAGAAPLTFEGARALYACPAVLPMILKLRSLDWEW